ncbi:MAG: VWA domain-containing protein [Spirochaetota bacterium]|nr:VWA domain-containing protein [Spirochaetota bacterium]
MHHKFVTFPFAAIIGHDLMKKGLLVNAIDTSISGILIKGDKGTGKSTAVRALAKLLPKIDIVKDCAFRCHPGDLRLMCQACQDKYKKNGGLVSIKKKMEVIDMPLSATEDVVVGTIDIKNILSDGIKSLEPGILARANRNILYIDEVNLLEDHLVNILLDASAMGVNIVEREGVSLYHPSRFILIGTMNPEEGELRPQLLDRFGLCVEMNALTSSDQRLEVIKRRSEFDSDPWRFEERFREEEDALRKEIVDVQSLFNKVDISHEMLEKIVKITTHLGIKTHRADIVMEKTSRALAALDNRDFVSEQDINEAALLSLPHRMHEHPFDKSKAPTKETLETFLNSKSKDEIFDFERDAKLKNDVLNINSNNIVKGRHSSKAQGGNGLYIRARESKNPQSLAIDATIRKSVKDTGKLQVRSDHLMEKVRTSNGKALYIILLDSSSSMRMERKIGFAKTLAWNILRESYKKKDKLSLFAFRNEDSKMLVPPTTDVSKVEKALEELPIGGKTPLTTALYKAFQMSMKENDTSTTVILISDGKGNIFIKNSIEEDIAFLSTLAKGTNFIIVNSEIKNRSIGILEDMGRTLNGKHFYLEDVI